MMNAITQILSQQLTGGAVSTIAQRFGISETAANTAVQIGVPLILTALARNSSEPQGAQDLHQAINDDHDGSIFDNLTGYLQNPQTANGSGILAHVFGGKQSTVSNNLAQATGLDQNSASGVLETLAPLVMGAVGQTQQQNSLDASDLSNLLNSEHQQRHENAPGFMGMLGSMLDQNQDGSAMDDLQRIAAKIFK